MLKRTVAATFLLSSLLIPSLALAWSCSPGDTDCSNSRSGYQYQQQLQQQQRNNMGAMRNQADQSNSWQRNVQRNSGMNFGPSSSFNDDD